jgi:hypothetical protein
MASAIPTRPQRRSSCRRLSLGSFCHLATFLMDNCLNGAVAQSHFAPSLFDQNYIGISITEEFAVCSERRYAGGLAIPLPFGTLFSTNVTPDKETGIGDYSDAEFLNAVQRGIRRDGTRLYPAMPRPCPIYSRQADRG